MSALRSSESRLLCVLLLGKMAAVLQGALWKCGRELLLRASSGIRARWMGKKPENPEVRGHLAMRLPSSLVTPPVTPAGCITSPRSCQVSFYSLRRGRAHISALAGAARPPMPPKVSLADSNRLQSRNKQNHRREPLLPQTISLGCPSTMLNRKGTEDTIKAMYDSP